LFGVVDYALSFYVAHFGSVSMLANDNNLARIDRRRRARRSRSSHRRAYFGPVRSADLFVRSVDLDSCFLSSFSLFLCLISVRYFGTKAIRRAAGRRRKCRCGELARTSLRRLFG
jgi:hypothetical protein